MKIITCLGDSITDCEHCFCPDSMGNGYVKLLSERLFNEGFDCQVRNRGTDGFTIQRLLQRVCASDDFHNNIVISHMEAYLDLLNTYYPIDLTIEDT